VNVCVCVYSNLTHIPAHTYLHTRRVVTMQGSDSEAELERKRLALMAQLTADRQ
jgi:hypothetical protein